MSKVVDLASRRPPPKSAPIPADAIVPDIYVLRIHREAEHLGEFIGLANLTPMQKRVIAADLIELTRAMLADAYQNDGDIDHNLIGEYRVMASGRLTGWTSPQVDTPDKLDWLAVTVTGLAGTVPTIPGA